MQLLIDSALKVWLSMLYNNKIKFILTASESYNNRYNKLLLCKILVSAPGIGDQINY